jgi:uncharacterized protein (TIRG00374 family)
VKHSLTGKGNTRGQDESRRRAILPLPLPNHHLEVAISRPRQIFFTVIIAFAFYFGFTHKEELQLVLQVFGQGDWRWLLAAVGVQLLWLVNIGAAFQSTYRLVGVREQLSRMVPLTTAANFVNVVAPSYGIGALAVLIADGNQRSKPAAKVTTAAVLYLVYDYLGFMVVLALGLFIFYRRGLLDTVLIAASAFSASIAIGLFVLMIFGIQSSPKLGTLIPGLLQWINRILRPFLRRDLIDRKRYDAFARDITEGLQHVKHAPWLLILPGVLALTRKLCMMAILFLVTKAFGHPIPLDTLIAGFTTSYLFIIASITPSGVGFVEGALTLYLHALGVPLATSAVISVAYRGITFWLTLAYGVIAIRWVGYSPKQLRQERSLQDAHPQDAIPNSVPPSAGQKTLPQHPVAANPLSQTEDGDTAAKP